MDSNSNQEDNAVLFVGEGDFSFSAHYILANEQKKVKEKVYASCLCLDSLTEKQSDNIEKILLHGGIVCTDADATKLESHPLLKDVKFGKIVFNFPHIPGKMNIKRNRDLVQQFFISAEKLLCNDGCIWVTLCQGQGGTEIERIIRKNCDTWQIVSLAACANMILNCVMPFDAKQFESYECTGFRGQDKPFNTRGALVHIFRHAKSNNDVLVNCESPIDLISFESLSQRFGMLQKEIDENSSPTMKVLSELINYNKSFVDHQTVLGDLLICKKLSASYLNSVPYSGGVDFCDSCLVNLSANFLSNKNYDYVTSVACSVCCTQNISINLHPISHVLCYYSYKIPYIFECLYKLLEHLNSLYCSDNQDEVHIANHQAIMEAKAEIKTNEVNEKILLNIYAYYTKNKSEELLHYSDIKFLLSSSAQSNKGVDFKKVGHVFFHFDNSVPYICILLNLEFLACLKYHVMDYRILFINDAYYQQSYNIHRQQIEVYRSISIFPPTYVHDISFYIEDNFSETHFFIVILNILHFSIKSVALLESYYDNTVKKHSRCYRFTYQSYHHALSKRKVNEIHTQVVRWSLQKTLNITLR